MKKKSILKKILGPILVPATKKYLRKARSTHFLGLNLDIPLGVFHPSFFLSTKTMGQWLYSQHIKNKKVLEIGCGSGAISIIASKCGAKVHCCDINPIAVKATLANAQKNEVELHPIRSDLFGSVTEINFDLILNNPPYYPKDPSTIEDYAWNAGMHLEYFQRLFKDVKQYLAPNGQLLLVLSDECDLESIHQIAKNEDLIKTLVFTRPTFIEKTYIISYKIAG